MNYDLNPIPTTYDGVNFRSRLEATWAAFFDLVDWEWDYEPDIQLDGWIPDFTIKGDKLILMEVKPLPRFLDKEKIEKAIKGTKFEVLVVFNGLNVVDKTYNNQFGLLLIWWENEGVWETYWTDASFCYDGFSTEEMNWENRILGNGGKDIWSRDIIFNYMELWKVAKNMTRWRPH